MRGLDAGNEGKGHGTRVEVLNDNCILLRANITEEEQTALFAYIEQEDTTNWADMPRVLSPSPKTIIFKENCPTLRFWVGEQSVVANVVARATRVVLDVYGPVRESRLGSLLGAKYKAKSELSMAAIRYKAPDGKFPPHVDHSNSVVYLMSLGCSANFMVQGPGDHRHTFEFRSGDVLVFDASSEAYISHGVDGVKPASCPAFLRKLFPILTNHRYGVQCRLK